jgi:excinuclease ABC subunit A
LAKELSKNTKNHTLYLLDEPTTGLHPKDVSQLLVLLNKLVDAGNTVILVEQNLDLIKRSDWVIDIGPEGGEKGGTVVAEGTPEEIARIEASYTGRFLKEKLGFR